MVWNGNKITLIEFLLAWSGQRRPQEAQGQKGRTNHCTGLHHVDEAFRALAPLTLIA
jgi:hypothetical protein